MRGRNLIVVAGLAAGCALVGSEVRAQPAPNPVPLAADASEFARHFAPPGTTAGAPDADGFIRRWLLLEPIDKPNRSNAGFTGSYVREALAPPAFAGNLLNVPRDGSVVTAGEPLRWHALDSRSFDVRLFNFAQGLGKRTYGVIFWAATVIDSPVERRNVRMALGSNSASIWWLNGKEAAGLFDDRRMVMDDVVSPRLTLRKGRNVVWGAVINGPGLSDFCVRFLDDQGAPIRGLAVRTR
ncbi:acetylxylan esterase [Sphingosinicella sp. BN140058]|uniref:acetylxylan esterase n=1 Tax=Sphingosinicella sp. BN140058 TaxID=1892855 RepID=UPI0010123FE4|nr:acetylxylan esterase [Sphingosinicella sp. BN140058]QAY75934.1 acetylxylan esterase [Sphingosinicella sp. BN140058]